MFKNKIKIFTLLLALGSLTGCSSSDGELGPIFRETKATSFSNPLIRKSMPDPSVIKATNGYFYVYATEDTKNTPIYKSKDLINWSFVGTAFTTDTRPKFFSGGMLWAPDINYINGQYVLYYSLSNTTAAADYDAGVGAATSNSPEGPFTDRGKVFNGNDVNVKHCIDQFYWEEDGHKYMFWGSFAGIYAIELSDDGLSIKDGAQKVQVAGTCFEATNIVKHDGYYYILFSTGNWKINNNYRVVMGRSQNLLGPYVTKSGARMLDNNYDLLMQGDQTFKSPGHNAEIITDDEGTDWMIFHSYLAAAPELNRCLMMAKLQWGTDGWPFIDNNVPPVSSETPVFKNN